MKRLQSLTLIVLTLSMAACEAAPTAAAESTPIPIAIADDTIISEGKLEPIHFAEIAFSAGGVVSEVPVKDGQPVKKGQLLIRLGNESDKNYTAAQLELVNAQKAWNDLLNSRDADFANAVIKLKDAKEAYERADNYLIYLRNSKKVPQTERHSTIVKQWNGYAYEYKTRYFKGPAPKDWIVEAENDLALKKAEMDEFQRAYDRLKDGPDADQLPLLEARLNAAKAGVAAFEVTAPFDGIVAQLNAKTGSSISAGEIAVTIADISNWTVVTTDLTENDVVNIQEGQSVAVKLDAIPGVEFNGNVLSIGNNYTINQGDVVYEATILLTDRDAAMRWGMTAVVTFK